MKGLESYPWVGALNSFFIFPKKMSNVAGSLFAPISVKIRALDTSEAKTENIIKVISYDGLLYIINKDELNKNV